MKKIIYLTLLLGTFKAFAFGVNLAEIEIMIITELNEMGATTVECSQMKPRCIIIGSRYGIQYPGQSYSQVALEDEYNAQTAFSRIKSLKEAGLCE